MHHLQTLLLQHLVSASASLWLLLLVVILFVIVFEDATIALVGILSSEHYIPLLFGIVALIMGIVIGDSIAYTIGRLATHHRFAKRIIEHERVGTLRVLLHKRPEFTIFSGRFMPGFRFSLYMACGFFAIPYKRFVSFSFVSATAWAITLSTVSFLFGMYTLNLLGYWRWPILAGVILLLFYMGHRHWRKITATANIATTQNDTGDDKDAINDAVN